MDRKRQEVKLKGLAAKETDMLLIENFERVE